jgi:hypothetical protein
VTALQPTVTPGNGIGVSAQPDLPVQEQLSAARDAAAGRVDPGATPGGGAVSLGGGGPLVVAQNQKEFDSARRQYLLERGLNSVNKGVRDASAHGIAAGDTAAVQNRATASAERIAGLRDRGETTRAAQANLTNTLIHRANNETAERGQDLTLAGHKMTNAVQIANQRRDQANKDREFQQNTYKLGEELEGKAADRRADAVKNLHTEIAGMLPPNAEGKPDLDTASRYAVGLNAAVGDRQRALQAELQRNPGNADAASELAGLNKHGMNALDPVAKQKFIDGMRLKDLRDANHSALNPFGGTTVQSNAPVAGLRRKPGLITDDYETLDAAGRPDGGTVPARAVDRPGSFLGLGGRRDNSYDSLKRN